ncbi:MAG TPA: DUF2752 domain-containing protein [Acidimicrobiia bacterium]|nr:DUF2752 domain-containing protein [Acidimicrobiia bacterium]
MTLTRRDRLIFLSPLAAVGMLTLAQGFEDGPTVCPFALATGMACPGCGMTRAAGQLLRGDFAAAIAYHPLVPAVALLATVGWAWFVLRRTGQVQPMSNRMLNGVLMVLLIALIAVWVTRLATGSLPPV